MGIELPPPSASCSPLSCAPPTSRASGHQVMWCRLGMSLGSPVSRALTPMKLTWPCSSRLTVAKPGSSKSQALHHEAKKFTTVGWPRNWARATVPSPWRAGSDHAAGSVDTPGAWADLVRLDWLRAARNATSVTTAITATTRPMIFDLCIGCVLSAKEGQPFQADVPQQPLQ